MLSTPGSERVNLVRVTLQFSRSYSGKEERIALLPTASRQPAAMGFGLLCFVPVACHCLSSSHLHYLDFLRLQDEKKAGFTGSLLFKPVFRQRLTQWG